MPENLAPPRKNWWTPVWRGLVLDSSAKHYKQMRGAVWLYLYLLVYARRQTGTLFRRLSTISAETGFSARNLQRWLKLLRERGYVKAVWTGTFWQIAVSKWKPIQKEASSKATLINARTQDERKN